MRVQNSELKGQEFVRGDRTYRMNTFGQCDVPDDCGILNCGAEWSLVPNGSEQYDPVEPASGAETLVMWVCPVPLRNHEVVTPTGHRIHFSETGIGIGPAGCGLQNVEGFALLAPTATLVSAAPLGPIKPLEPEPEPPSPEAPDTVADEFKGLRRATLESMAGELGCPNATNTEAFPDRGSLMEEIRRLRAIKAASLAANANEE